MSDEMGVPEEMRPTDEPVVEPVGEPAAEPVAAPEPEHVPAEVPGTAAAAVPMEAPMAPPAPPEPVQGSVSPVPPMPPAMPVVSAKPRSDALFFTLGFIAALIFLPIAAGALGALLSLNVNLSGAVSSVALLVLVLVVVAVFWALMRAGRTRDNNRLRSFGKGGLWASIAVPLVMLAAVGSCLVLVGQN